jgi:hypothetical protein
MLYAVFPLPKIDIPTAFIVQQVNHTDIKKIVKLHYLVMLYSNIRMFALMFTD